MCTEIFLDYFILKANSPEIFIKIVKHTYKYILYNIYVNILQFVKRYTKTECFLEM